MTDENGAVASKKKPELRLPSQLDPGTAERLVAQSRAEGVDLVGPGGLLRELTKQICLGHPPPAVGVRRRNTIGRPTR